MPVGQHAIDIDQDGRTGQGFDEFFRIALTDGHRLSPVCVVELLLCHAPQLHDRHQNFEDVDPFQEDTFPIFWHLDPAIDLPRTTTTEQFVRLTYQV